MVLIWGNQLFGGSDCWKMFNLGTFTIVSDSNFFPSFFFYFFFLFCLNMLFDILGGT